MLIIEINIIMWLEDIPGLRNYVVDVKQYEIKLPAVLISVVTLEKLRSWLNDGKNITARMTSEGNLMNLLHFMCKHYNGLFFFSDVNEWALMMESGAMIFYSVFMSAFTVTCIGLATYKLIMFVQAKGCQESMPQTILIFEIIANVSKFQNILFLQRSLNS